MKKNDWLELANGLYNWGLSDAETIDNIVLRIAKELNIETNSVKITDLKKNVLTEIEVIKQRGANADETNDESISEVIEEPITEEPVVEEIKEEPKVVYSELDNLRAETKSIVFSTHILACWSKDLSIIVFAFSLMPTHLLLPARAILCSFR